MCESENLLIYCIEHSPQISFKFPTENIIEINAVNLNVGAFIILNLPMYYWDMYIHIFIAINLYIIYININIPDHLQYKEQYL